MGCTLQEDEVRIPRYAIDGADVRSVELPPTHVASSLSLEHVLVAAQAAASKTLEETVILDVAEFIVITDYFVVTSGRNDRQVRSIVDEVSKAVRESGGNEKQIEGLGDASWVLLDYGDFVVHVFSAEAREYYALERLWADSHRLDWSPEREIESAAP